MKRKYTEEDKARAAAFLQPLRGRTLLGIVNSVSRSGMSRRIEYYAAGTDGKVWRIGWAMSAIADFSYDVDKGGILAHGCGMDMIWHCIYNFNMAMKRREFPDRDIYSDPHAENCNYFFTEHYDR